MNLVIVASPSDFVRFPFLSDQFPWTETGILAFFVKDWCAVVVFVRKFLNAHHVFTIRLVLIIFVNLSISPGVSGSRWWVFVTECMPVVRWKSDSVLVWISQLKISGMSSNIFTRVIGSVWISVHENFLAICSCQHVGVFSWDFTDQIFSDHA